MSKLDSNLIKELQEIYGFSRSFIESLQDGLLIINLKGEIIIGNTAINHITGFESSELIGAKVPFPFWPEEFHDKYKSLFKDLSKEEMKKEINVIYKHKDGARFSASMYFASIKNNQNQVIAYIAVVSDTSKAQTHTPSVESYNQEIFSVLNYKKKYLDILSEKKITFQLETTLDSISDGFISLDSNWCYTYINKKAAKLLGRKPESLIGKHIWTEFPEGVGQSFYKAYYKAFETQETVYFNDYYAPYDKWFENKIYPSPDGIAIYFNDITALKNTEALLDKSEQNLDHIINNIGDPVFVKNDKSHMIIVNDAFCKMFNLARSQFLNRSIPEELASADWEKFIEVDKKVLETGVEDLSEESFTLEGKEKRTISTKKTRYIDNDGNKFIIGTIRDITDQKKIDANNQMLLSLIETSNDFIGLATLEGKPIYLNRLGKKMIGLQPEDDLPQNVSHIFPEEKREKVLNEHFTVMNRKSEWNGKATFKNLTTGQLIPIEMSGFIIKDLKTNTPMSLGIVAKDISTSQEAEEKLIKSEQLFKRLTSKAPAGIFQTDTEGACNYVNKRWLEYAGLSYEEAMGYGWADTIHPDDKDRILVEWQKYMLSEENEIETEFRFLHKNKKVTWVSVKTVGTYDAQNKLYGYIGMALDTTDRKEAEEKLIKSEQLFRRLSSNAPVAIFQTDQNGSCNYVNQEWMKYSGLTFNEALDSGWRNAIHPEDRDYVMVEWEKSVAKKQEFILDYRFLDKKGKSTYLSAKTTGLYDSDNQLYGYVGMLVDITERKEAEEQIISSRQYLNNIINTIGDPVFVKDDKSQFILVNDAFCTNLDLPRSAIIGNKLTDNFSSEVEKKVLKNDKAVLLTGVESISEETISLSNKSDDIKILSSKKTRFIDSNGDKYIIGVIRDLTESKKADEEIRMAHQRLTTHLNNSPLAIVEWDKDFVISSWSGQAENIFGWKASEALGKQLIDLNLVYEEDIAKTDNISNELRSGKVKNNKIVNRNNTKAGKVIYCQWYNSVLQSTDGQVDTVLSLIQDVTESKVAEEKLINSEQLFKRLSSNAPVAIYQTDKEGLCNYVNEEWTKFSGLTFSESMGTSWVNAIHPDDKTRVVEEWKKAVAREKEFILDFKLLNKKGETLWLSAKTSGLYDVNNNLYGYIGTLVDISERKKSEFELEKYRNNLEQLVELRTEELEKEKVKAQSADLMKSAFLATMSHELRTPMNSIIGFTGLLLKEVSGALNTEQKKQIAMVKNSGEHLLNLINDILDISKIEAGKLKVTFKPFDYLTALDKTIAFLNPQISSKGLGIRTEISELDITLVSDAGRVEQILLNLISNAIKFSNQGTIVIKVDVEDKLVVTQIIDQGIGIHKNDLQKLFKPFSQLKADVNKTQEGTGLGLSICKSLIDKLGGVIQVESKVGQGSNFTFKLPLSYSNDK
jgi:PAS domain S-box-containing protein